MVKYSILGVLSLLLFVSCSNRQENKILERAQHALDASNEAIGIDNWRIIKELEYKRAEPATHYSASIYFPKAEQIDFVFEKSIKKIESIHENYLSKKPDIFADTLITTLSMLKIEILKIDTMANREFEKQIEAATSLDKDYLIPGKSWSNVEEKIMLTTIQNNLLILENQLLNFINSKVTDNTSWYNVYTILVNSNRKEYKPGEIVKIEAGLGAFKVRPKTQISIDGKDVEINARGEAHYNFNAPSSKGKHKVKVVLRYIDEMGKDAVIKKWIDYEVY